jgi:hypothetical protein
MNPTPGQSFDLQDRHGRRLGTLTVEANDGGLLSGGFVPGADFAGVEALFRSWQEAVEGQALSLVDDFDRSIVALGLTLQLSSEVRPLPVSDVQIWSDGTMTCRVPVGTPGLVNGAPEHRQRPSPVAE